MLVATAEKMIEQKVEMEQLPDGSIERTETQTKKEIATPQGQPHEVQPARDPVVMRTAGRDYTFDPMTVLLWLGIAGAVIWLVFSHKRNR